MRGWRYSLDPNVAPEGAIGIVVAQNFPDEAMLKTTLRQGVARRGAHVVWVMLNEPKANHSARWAAEVFEEFEIEPVYAPLLPYWQRKQGKHRVVVLPNGNWQRVVPPEYDFRADMRAVELRRTCERIVVFHDVNSTTTGEWEQFTGWDAPYEEGKYPCRAKINIVTAGKVKPKKRPSRKPTGA